MAKGSMRAWPVVAFLVAAAAAPLSCGSSDSGGGGASDAGAAGSAAHSANAGTSGSDLNLGGGSASAGADASDAGSSGEPSASCPLYSERCDGECIATSVDPKNCGGCGKSCAEDEVCSAGACSGECLPGLAACDQACIDLQNDSANCGECGTACAAGKGCVDGRCANGVPVDGSAKACPNGGPPIKVGTRARDCLGTLAETTFRWSLCSCNDFNVSARFSTDAYDSRKGPYKPGETGGGVGVDRDVTGWSDAVSVGGTLWIAGTKQYSSSGPASTVRTDLHLGGSWKASTPFTVDGAAYVSGELSGVTVTGKTETVASVPAACDCSPQQLVPIADLVEAHRTSNDNAVIGLDEAALDDPGAAIRLDLPCGSYFLSAIKSSLALTVHVHGRTAIYVAGDVSASSSLAFTLDPGAELDLFVAGTLKASDTFVFGSPSYPALSRAYIGGTAKIALSSDVRLAGQLYAANSSELVWSAKNEIYGSIFAGSFHGSDVTTIHYDRAVLHAGDFCPPDPKECGSCEDCHNQACKKGECSACTGDSDCCSPLVCNNGSCEPQVVVVK